jgi:hypothetical protein
VAQFEAGVEKQARRSRCHGVVAEVRLLAIR